MDKVRRDIVKKNKSLHEEIEAFMVTQDVEEIVLKEPLQGKFVRQDKQVKEPVNKKTLAKHLRPILGDRADDASEKIFDNRPVTTKKSLKYSPTA